MKSILMSIQPKWVEKIISGEKTIEVRKTAPKEVPFRAFIYCTKQRFPNKKYLYINETRVRSEYGVCNDWLKYDTDTLNINEGTPYQYETYFANGKIIGEFVCDKVDKVINHGSGFSVFNESKAYTNCVAKQSGLYFDDLKKYLETKDGYAWHITDLKIYDKPRELGEFRVTRKKSYYAIPYDVSSYRTISRYEPITHPPQSWQYVREI